MEQSFIIKYLSGLTGFMFDASVLEVIAMERGVTEVTSIDELDQKTKDLLRADVLYAAYFSPTSSASMTKQHGAFTQTVGSQTINDRKHIYNMMIALYRKWNDEKLEEVLEGVGGIRGYSLTDY